MKIPLVLFSGGLDSTYLVSYMLSEEGPIDILYVNGGQHPEKIRLELEHRDRLIAQLNEYYPNKIRCTYECLKQTYFHSGINKKWNQPNAWMQGAFHVIDPELHSCIRLAYVSDDGAHFGYHLKHLEQQWRSMQELGFNGDPIPIDFPLLAYTKLNVMEEIDKRLLPNVWVCEAPSDGKACQSCNPCMLANETLAKYKAKHGETVWRAVSKAKRLGNPWYSNIESDRNFVREGNGRWVENKHSSYKDYRFIPEIKLSEAVLR